MWITLIFIFLIPIVIFFYGHFTRELKDIDPVLLNHQTSISETRKSSESAIYRSVDVPHGVAVTRGLSLRSGYKIRDGCLKDIWFCALSKGSDMSQVILGDKSFNINQLNTIFHLISEKIEKITTKDAIAVYGDLIDHPELLLVIWSCFFVNDKTVILYNSKQDLKVKNEYEIDTIFTCESNIIDIENNLNIIGINIGIDVDESEIKSSKFTEILSFTNEINESLEYKYNPETDFLKVNNHPYSIINNDHETKFFQLNFVSAIASKLMSIPGAFSWNNEDNLVISYTKQSFTSTNIIFQSCCGFLSNVKKMYIVPPLKISTLKKLAELNPTLLSLDTHILKNLCNTKKSFWESFKLQRSEYLNSIGYNNSIGKIEKSLNLKTIFACQLQPQLSSFICNFCKSIIGCRIVREIYSDFTIGPILKTNIYDYRIVQNRSLILFGVPANSVELKTINPSEEETNGKLYMRGMSIGKGENLKIREEYWVDTGIKGKFARDGCFYGSF